LPDFGLARRRRQSVVPNRRDATEAFNAMVEQIDEDVVKYMLTVRFRA